MTAGDAPTPAFRDPVDVVSAYLAALSAHEPDGVCALVTEDFFNEHTAVRGTSFRGRDSYRRRLEGFFQEMVDLHYAIERMVASDETVVVAYRMTARWRHEERLRPFDLRGVFW
ncbi:MAG: nuclear transport factor 2 family protein, partial [Acidimicrobiales bacterium]